MKQSINTIKSKCECQDKNNEGSKKKQRKKEKQKQIKKTYRISKEKIQLNN